MLRFMETQTLVSCFQVSFCCTPSIDRIGLRIHCDFVAGADVNGEGFPDKILDPIPGIVSDIGINISIDDTSCIRIGARIEIGNWLKQIRLNDHTYSHFTGIHSELPAFRCYLLIFGKRRSWCCERRNEEVLDVHDAKYYFIDINFKVNLK